LARRSSLPRHTDTVELFACPSCGAVPERVAHGNAKQEAIAEGALRHGLGIKKS